MAVIFNVLALIVIGFLTYSGFKLSYVEIKLVKNVLKPLDYFVYRA